MEIQLHIGDLDEWWIFFSKSKGMDCDRQNFGFGAGQLLKRVSRKQNKGIEEG